MFPTYYLIIYSHHDFEILFMANILDSTTSEKLQRKSIITTNTEMTSNYATTVINYTKNLKLVFCIF